MAKSKFIKSQVKTDPAKLDYYRKKYNRLCDRIYDLYAECERIDPTGTAPETREEKAVRHKIAVLGAQRDYYRTQLKVCFNIQEGR